MEKAIMLLKSDSIDDVILGLHLFFIKYEDNWNIELKKVWIKENLKPFILILFNSKFFVPDKEGKYDNVQTIYEQWKNCKTI